MSRILALLALAIALALAATAQTAFTYQGRLTDGGMPVSGTRDFVAGLFTTADQGTAIHQIVLRDVPVTNGLFTLELPFGPQYFDGGARWLQIEVAMPGANGFTPLLPRQRLTAAPMAIVAHRLAADSTLNIIPPFGTANALSVTAQWDGAAADPDQASATYGSTVGLPDGGWQSFTAGMTGRLAAVDLHMGSTTGYWTVTMSIREGEGPGGALLTSQSLTGGVRAWYPVALATPVSVVAGRTYSIVFTGTTANRPAMFCWYNLYANGRCDQSETLDYEFRTYVTQRRSATNLFVKGNGLGVGIGTDTPRGALDVAGTVYASALDINGPLKATGFLLPVGAGMGKALVSDAAGNGAWQNLPAALPPTGPAGGDLAGSYPNPTIPSLAWGKITGAPSSLPPSGVAGGDLAGAYPNPTLKTDAASLAKVTGGGMAMNGANVGIGTATAGQRLQVDGGNALIRGGNNFQDLYTLNPPTTTPGSASLYLGDSNYYVRAVRGQGLIFGASGTANVSVDTFGNMNIADPSKLKFGSSMRQMVNLYGATYGLGVQANTLYQRSAGGFAWFKGGVHNDAANVPGTGGAALMALGSDGKLGLGSAAGGPTTLLHVAGSQTGNWASPLTKIENTNATGNSGPALSVVGSANAPDGVLNIASHGTGKVLVCGSDAGGGEVASIDVNGNMTLKGTVTAANIKPAVAAKQSRYMQQGSTGHEVSGGSHNVLDEITFTAPGPGKVLIMATAQVGGDASFTGNLAGYFNLDDATNGDPSALLDRAFIMGGYDHITLTVLVDAVTDRPMRFKSVVADLNDEKEKCFYWGHSLTATYIPNSM